MFMGTANFLSISGLTEHPLLVMAYLDFKQRKYRLLNMQIREDGVLIATYENEEEYYTSTNTKKPEVPMLVATH